MSGPTSIGMPTLANQSTASSRASNALVEELKSSGFAGGVHNRFNDSMKSIYWSIGQVEVTQRTASGALVLSVSKVEHTAGAHESSASVFQGAAASALDRRRTVATSSPLLAVVLAGGNVIRGD